MKNWISAVAGVLLTAWMAYDLNRTFDRSGGAGQTPREFVARYLEQAYTQGQGEAAAKEFLAPKAIDHVANAIDRQDGEPIPHRIEAIIADGGTVAVVHRIEAARGQSAQKVVDVFKTARGKITERRRIAQVESP